MGRPQIDVSLPDGSIVQGVPEGTTKEQLLAKLVKVGHPAAASLAQQVGQEQTLKEMSPLGKFNAGMGSAFSNIGTGAKQLVGMDTDYARDKDAQAALLHTGAGFAGNVAGNVSAFAPLAVIPGAASVAGAGALGASAGALQPTDTAGQRLVNMGIGGAVGGGSQAIARYPNEILDAIGGVGKGLKATVEPLTESGREDILARALRKATGGNPDVLPRLQAGAELVPGSAPTAAEVGQSGGLAALQRSASAVDPEAYAARAAQQNEARVGALGDLTAGRDTLAAIRDEGANEMYGAARALGIDPARAKMMEPQVKNLMERMPSGVMDKARELARVNGETLGPEGSVQGLHWAKLAVDDMLSSARQTGIGAQTERALTQFKSDMMATVDELSPAYGHARQSFAEMSRPVSQKDIVQAISDKSINKLTGALQPQAFARALSDDTARSATGFNKATLASALEPEQLGSLNAIKEDLARSVQARDLGRGPGSNTAQNLAMSNLMQRSGMPEGVLNMPAMGRFGSWIYDKADEAMKKRLAAALLNPQDTASLLSRAPPSSLPATTNPALGARSAAIARALVLPAIATEAGR